MIVKSRASTLAEVVPWAPKRCPTCRHKVGSRFWAIYTGTPEDKTLIGWQCKHCDTEFGARRDDYGQ